MMESEKNDLKRKRKKNSIVQFNIVNNTNSPIFQNLFNIDSLTQIPTSGGILPPSNQTYSISFFSGNIRDIVLNPTNGDYFVSRNVDFGTIAIDSNNNFISGISGFLAGARPYKGAYCPVNNSIYFTDFNTNRIYVIDCATYALVTQINFSVVTGLTSIAYCSSTNEMYVGSASSTTPINIIDCSTNTVVSVPVLPLGRVQDIQYNSLQNQIYYIIDDGLSPYDIGIIDCSTSTFLSSFTVSLTNNALSLQYCPSNNTIFVGFNALNVISVVDCSTNTIIQTIPFSGSLTSVYSIAYSSNFDIIYFSSITANLLFGIDVQTLSIVSVIPVTTPFALVIDSLMFSDNTETLYVGNQLNITAFQGTLTPFYISGVPDYNFFVQNLEYEPIEIEYIRIISNQNQLSNTLQVKYTDANGNQAEMPHFPILGVSNMQEQGNIGMVDFKGKLVLDGRTYFSNYLINPNESVTFEIHFVQLDRAKIKTVFTNLFPIKRSLKDIFDEYVEL